jgi:hypothetical protein
MAAEDKATEKLDRSTARINAISTLVRSFAWPCVAFVGMYFFAGTIDRLVSSTQKFSFAGVAIEKFVGNNALSDDQIETISSLSTPQILEFIQRYESGSRQCITESDIRPLDHILIEAGLIKYSEGECGELDSFLGLSIEGERLQSAIGEMIGDFLKTAITN